MKRKMGMSPSSSNSDYRTSNLTEAAFLIGRGHEPRLVRKGRGAKGQMIGAWVFKFTETLNGDIRMFDQRLAKVEPKAFHNTLSQTRRELVRFLEADAPTH